MDMEGKIRGGGRECLHDILNRAEEISLLGCDVIIWGAGNTTELNQKAILENGLLPLFFVDGDSEKWGGLKWNIEVISPDDIKVRCINPVVLISSANPETCREIKEQLEKMGIAKYHMIDEVIWGKHKEEILAVFEMLESEQSKELLIQVILSRIAGEDIPERYVTDNQYFAVKNFKLRNAREIFVDCGAYVGDTLERYLCIKDGVFDKIYAFEPDTGNFNALSKRIERLKDEWNISGNRIHIIANAVGKEDGNLFINNDIGGLGAKVTDAGLGREIQVCKIDSYFKDTPIGFIKADIEGYELDLLEGAAANIKKYKPLLAICIYHQSADIYKIPLLIKELNREYRMDMAHHYYNYTETVLYAY